MTQLIKPQTKHIGFDVRRILPSPQRWMVGPFIFLDHMGPATFVAGTTEGDVRPHPHIGLATVTWLYSGAFLHRDSLGVQQRIEPGAVNLMVAGRGVVHSERIPADIREAQTPVEGLQLWLALPADHEEVQPWFRHYADLPLLTGDRWEARLLIGAFAGRSSPVEVPMPTLCVDLQLEAGARYSLPALQGEAALYLAHGDLAVDTEPLPHQHLLVLEGERERMLTSAGGARLMLVGGAPYPERRHVVWNFVSTRSERIKQAQEDWKAQRFEPVPGETEFIPLPG